MKKSTWVMLIVFISLVALTFWVSGSMMGFSRTDVYNNPGFLRGMPGWGNHMTWGLSPTGWWIMGFTMLFMWLIPVGVIALVIYAIVVLVRSTGHSPTHFPQQVCPNCNKVIQPDWQVCPYCRTALK
ncbi:MAG: zinc ribbon domain-containing protein [Chloroflexota bacterium]|nr:MAG: hypothetical protein KatS3mg045_1457 [Bellilinea sp.]